MFRFLFRALGFILLAAATMFAVIDGTKTIAASKLMLTPFGHSWKQTHPDSLIALQKTLEDTVRFAWDPVMTTLLAAPTSLVAAVIALLFLKLGKTRRRPYV